MENISQINTKPLKDSPKVWLIFIILLPVLVNTIRNPNNDFGTIAAIVREWVGGKTVLYSAGSAYFSYAPWALLVYLPLAYIPHPFGQLIFNIASLSLLIWSTWYVAKPVNWRVMAISITTIYTCMLIIQGQYDALILSALILGWIAYKRKNPWLLGIALVGLTSKYSYILIPLILLIVALRAWSIKKILYAVIIPLLIFAGSFLVVGWDWPVRYSKLMGLQLKIYTQYEVVSVFNKTVYQVSYWLMQPPIGTIVLVIAIIISAYLLVRMIQKGIDQNTLLFALALNLVIAPYFTFHHGIYLAPVHAQLYKNYPILGYILFGAAILDILFLWIGIGLITYPLVALVLLFVSTFRSLKRPELNIAFHA